MAQYVYVLAFFPNKAAHDEETLCFEHGFVKAKDADEAYTKGMRVLDPKVRTENRRASFMNNYVVLMPEGISGE